MSAARVSACIPPRLAAGGPARWTPPPPLPLEPGHEPPSFACPLKEEKPLDKVAIVNPDDLEKEALAAAAEARSSGFTMATLSNRSEEHTSELQSAVHLVCRLLLEKETVTVV